eukprot:3355118-Rhodomonas_salina.1
MPVIARRWRRPTPEVQPAGQIGPKTTRLAMSEVRTTQGAISPLLLPPSDKVGSDQPETADPPTQSGLINQQRMIYRNPVWGPSGPVNPSGLTNPN